ncbi:hypothetical protein L195_g059254, partial [Trifolium pratense]
AKNLVPEEKSSSSKTPLCLLFLLRRKILCLRRKFHQKKYLSICLFAWGKNVGASGDNSMPGTKMLVAEAKFSFIDSGYKRKTQI